MTTLKRRSATASALARGHRFESRLGGVDDLPALLGRCPKPLGQLSGVAGGQLVEPRAVAEGNFDRIRDLARQYVAIVQQTRKEISHR